MAPFHILENIYDETYAVVPDLLDNWVNPYTSGASPIQGLSLFALKDTDWEEGILQNLYLIDYFVTHIVNTSGSTDRALSGDPIIVGDSTHDRLTYLWDIIKHSEVDRAAVSGTIEAAEYEWGANLYSSGNLSAVDFTSYLSTLDASGYPYLGEYELAAAEYWDNYDGEPVLLYDQNVGAWTSPDTGISGLSIDLSVDSDLDSLAAPVGASGYLTKQSGYDGYFETAASTESYVTVSESTALEVSSASTWSDDQYDGVLDDTGATIVNPTNPEWATETDLKKLTVAVNDLALPSGTNVLSRDIAQKSIVYTTRKLNQLHRVTYGTIDGFATDIDTYTDLPFSFASEDDGAITPSGTPGWPVFNNPFTSGEANPLGGILYDPATPDWVWRERVNELDEDRDGYLTYGSMPWLLSEMRYLRYRMRDLVGERTGYNGGRLWRSTAPITRRYDTIAELPSTSGGYFSATRDEADGLMYVEENKSYYYWDTNESAWRIEWSIDPATASGAFPGHPQASGYMVGHGVTGLPNADDDEWETYVPRPSGEYSYVPGLYPFQDIMETLHELEMTLKIVDQSVIDTYGINLEGWTSSSDPNTLGFDIENPDTQFVSLFKSIHDLMGSLPSAALQSGVIADTILADDFLDNVLFDGNDNFNHSEFIRGLEAIIEYHDLSVTELEVGEIDYEDKKNDVTFAQALVGGYYNKMDAVPSGSLQYVGPHRLGYVDEDNPGFYRGIRLTYYEEE